MANKSGGKPGDERAGRRPDRNQKVGKRVPALGYYLVQHCVNIGDLNV
jgi:hypothetical protein